MLFPSNIEHKLGFDEIRTLLRGHCITKLGVERVDSLAFMTDASLISEALAQVGDVERLLNEEGQLPGEDFFDLRAAVRKLHIEGAHLDEQELWELKRTLDTLHSWVAVIRAEGSPYPALERMAEGVFTFHKVCESIEGILDKFGHIKDGASPELSKIRQELRHAEGSVNRLLVALLEKAKQEGLVEQHVMPTMRDGRLLIPVPPALKRRMHGIVHDESASG